MSRLFTSFTEGERKSIRAIVSDVDDTITTDGLIYPDALQALFDIKKAGLKTILVTGGSAGWADGYIRLWPVDAVIAESGALLLYKKNGRIVYEVNPDIKSDPLFTKRRDTLLRETKDYVFSSDQYARLYDVAYEKSALTKDKEKKLYEIIESLGGFKLVSSIHVNVLFAPISKKKGIDAFFPILKEVLNLNYSLKEFYSSSLALGDSANDEAMFKAFKISVGNKRVSDNKDSFLYFPTYITDQYGSISFAHVISNLLNNKEI